MGLFNLRIHWRAPKHPTEIRSWTGRLSFKYHPPQNCFMTHEVGRWYGISHRRDWFVGFCLFGETRDYRSADPPRTGVGQVVPSPLDTSHTTGAGR